MEWRKPSTDIIDHHYVVALFYEENEEGDKELAIDMFTCESIYNTFSPMLRVGKMKLKDFILWYPIPKIPDDLTGGYPYVK